MFTWYTATANTSVPLFLRQSGDHHRLPGLYHSTSPSPSPHKRSGSPSIFYGPRGKEGSSTSIHARRQSDLVTIRALLLLSDWSIGHEVGTRRAGLSPRTDGEYPHFAPTHVHDFTINREPPAYILLYLKPVRCPRLILSHKMLLIGIRGSRVTI